MLERLKEVLQKKFVTGAVELALWKREGFGEEQLTVQAKND